MSFTKTKPPYHHFGLERQSKHLRHQKACFDYPLYAAEHHTQAAALCGSRPENDGLGPNQNSDTSQAMDVDASQCETWGHHNFEDSEQDNHAVANHADEHQICQQERSQSPCDGDGLAQFRSPSKERVDREHLRDLVVRDVNRAIPDRPRNIQLRLSKLTWICLTRMWSLEKSGRLE